MSEPMLVVDFGTSTSSAALVVGDSVRLVKEPASGSWCWPSAVCLDGENLLVGTAAERLRRIDPLVYRAEFKRDLGDPVPIVLGDKSFRPEDLVAEFIVALRQQAQRLCDQQLHRLVLTVPASYAVADTRRDLMIDAGVAAGFAEVELLTEPVAAAFAPVAGAPIRSGELVLVYDLGGGTFDAALVRTGEDGQHEVLGHGSLEDVGGRDIDATLFAHVRELGGDGFADQLDTAAADQPRRLAAHRMRTELADFVRQVKHQLSDAPSARDFFSPALLPVVVDRAELTTMVSSSLRRTVRCCVEVLASAGVEPGELTAALLVGGSTRMPVVAETVAAELGVPLRFAEDPSTAVVHGAANWVQRAGLRGVGPWSCGDGKFPVRWRLPGDTGTIVRWLVEPGDRFGGGEPLVVVRVADGALWRLFAGDHPGVLASRHASVGDRIVSGQWLVTVGSAAPSIVAAPIVVHHPHGTVNAVAFSSDGRWLATAARGSAGIWDARSGEHRRWLLHHSGSFLNGVAFSPDTMRVATACADTTALVWDAESGAQVLKLEHNGIVRDVVFSPDGARLATASASSSLGLARLWRAATGEPLLTLQHARVCWSVAFSADGRRVATACADGLARIWDAASGTLLHSFPLHGPVRAVAFNHDGKWLATGSEDRSARVWDVRSGQQLLSTSSESKVLSVAFSPDGNWLATGLADGSAWTTDLSDLLSPLEASGPQAESDLYHRNGRNR